MTRLNERVKIYHMAYSVDARGLVLKYRDNGHTLEETYNEFGVSISTIREWEKLRSEKGSLAKKELKRSPRIYKSEELKAFISENPDAYLREIAEHFGGSIAGAFEALEREKITYKKKIASTKNGMKISEANMIRNLRN